eukprot:m.53899 g.53899  ORF g.53899 m.53899 type:complete len:357 (+) comp10886_c1_seq1:199-1269(+)
MKSFTLFLFLAVYASTEAVKLIQIKGTTVPVLTTVVPEGPSTTHEGDEVTHMSTPAVTTTDAPTTEAEIVTKPEKPSGKPAMTVKPTKKPTEKPTKPDNAKTEKPVGKQLKLSFKGKPTDQIKKSITQTIQKAMELKGIATNGYEIIFILTSRQRRESGFDVIVKFTDDVNVDENTVNETIEVLEKPDLYKNIDDSISLTETSVITSASESTTPKSTTPKPDTTATPETTAKPTTKMETKPDTTKEPKKTEGGASFEANESNSNSKTGLIVGVVVAVAVVLAAVVLTVIVKSRQTKVVSRKPSTAGENFAPAHYENPVYEAESVPKKSLESTDQLYDSAEQEVYAKGSLETNITNV